MVAGGRPQHVLERLRRDYLVALHGVSLSVGSEEPVNAEHLGRLHGVTREVVLDAQYLGSAKDPWGNQRYGFHAETKINRKDFRDDVERGHRQGAAEISPGYEVVHTQEELRCLRCAGWLRDP